MCVYVYIHMYMYIYIYTHTNIYICIDISYIYTCYCPLTCSEQLLREWKSPGFTVSLMEHRQSQNDNQQVQRRWIHSPHAFTESCTPTEKG